MAQKNETPPRGRGFEGKCFPALSTFEDTLPTWSNQAAAEWLRRRVPALPIATARAIVELNFGGHAHG